jgi:hypothetical protein
VGGVSYPRFGTYGVYSYMTTWQAIDVGLNSIMPHTDVHAFAFTSDGTAYMGTDGGIWRYTPNSSGPNYSLGMNAIQPFSDVVADFNGDGKQDIAVANYSSNNVSVLRGNGDGTFQPAVTYPVGKGPVAIAAGDFNGDGRQDLAVANQNDNSVSILLANASGGFNPAVPVNNVGPNPQGIAVGDFTGDGKPDLAVAVGGNNTVQLLINNGTGGFTLGKSIGTGGKGPRAIAAADFNGDGKLDVAVLDTGSYTVDLLTGDGAGNFTHWQELTTGNSPFGLAVADFDGDGTPDVAVTNNADNTVIYYLNKAGIFTNQTVFAGTAPRGIVAADVNGDGRPDLVTANTDGTITTLLNTGSGTATFSSAYSSTLKVAGSAYGIAAGNLNGDKYNGHDVADLAVTDTGNNTVNVVIGTNNYPQAGGGSGVSGFPAQAYGRWYDQNGNLNTNQLYGVAMSPASSTTFLEASQDNGTALTTNDGGSWDTVDGGDGVLVRFDPTNANTAYMLQPNGYLFRSDNGGNNWTVKAPPGGGSSNPYYYPFSAPFVIDPLNTSQLLIGGLSNLLYTSTNKGDSWTQLTSPGDAGGGVLTALAYAPNNDGYIYAGFQDGQVYVSTDGGVSWNRAISAATPPWINPNPQPPNKNPNPITALAVDPTTATTVYVTVGVWDVEQVWQITNAGPTGTPKPITNGTGTNRPAGALPNVPTNTIVLDPRATNRTLYVGTDVGVYQGVLNAGAWTWNPYGAGLPAVQVTDLQLQTVAGRSYLIAGTYGRGAWWIDPPSHPRRSGAADDAEGRSAAPLGLTPDDFPLARGLPLAVPEPMPATMEAVLWSSALPGSLHTGSFSGLLVPGWPVLAGSPSGPAPVNVADLVALRLQARRDGLATHAPTAAAVQALALAIDHLSVRDAVFAAGGESLDKILDA